MKTTVDIPEPLYRRAKIRAAERGETLRQLVVQSLEQALLGLRPSANPPLGDDPLFTLDEFGFPVLKGREGVVVTERLINRIREEEGI